MSAERPRFCCKQPKAPYPFCWSCSRKLNCGARLYTKIVHGSGSAVYVHKECVEEAEKTLAEFDGTCARIAKRLG
jgi:hypothetical protein